MVVMAVAVVAIKGGMEEMVGWIDHIECHVFFFVLQMKSTVFFDTWHTVQYYSSWEKDEKKRFLVFSIF